MFTGRGPEVGFAPAGVPPAGPLYIGRGEQLVLDTWSSTAPGPLAIRVRMLRPEGGIHIGSWSHTPNSDGTRATTFHDLAEGWLLGVMVDAVGLAYAQGQCWCMVSLQIGTGAVGLPHTVLLTDYVTATTRLGWPGGQIGPPVAAAGGGAAAGGLHIGVDEHLAVDTWSSTAPGPLTITAQVLLAGGATQTTSWSHTPNTNRTRATDRYALTQGILLGVAVEAVGLAYSRGHCWCVVSVQYGAGPGGLVHGVLLADYVTGNARLGWPGGQIRSSVEGPGLVRAVIGTNPPPGVDIYEVVPAGVRWKLRAFTFELVTDATVASRIPILYVTDGTNTWLSIEPTVGQPTGTTRTYNWGIGYPARAMFSTRMILPFPVEVILRPGYEFDLYTSAMQAGDNLSAPQIAVEEWIEP